MTDQAVRDIASMVQKADIRWYERSAKRYFGEELESREPRDDTDLTLDLTVGRNVGDGDKERNAIIIRESLQGVLQELDFTLTAAVEWVFADGEKLTKAEVDAFVKSHGANYVLGILRGAAVDVTRSMGLPAMLVPFFETSELEDHRLQ